MARHFLRNPGFELGDAGWTKDAGFTIVAESPRTGAWAAKLNVAAGAQYRLESVKKFAVRPGVKVSASSYIDSSGAVAGDSRVIIKQYSHGGATIAESGGNTIAAAGGGYALSEKADLIIAENVKEISIIGFVIGAPPNGIWYFDDFDASGDIIESIPASAKITTHNLVLGRTQAAFEPLIGDTRFSEFNAGMSDKWMGVFTFVPMRPNGDLGELISFVERLGKVDRFFAFDPDRKVPKNGIVNGMVVDGADQTGDAINVRAGPVSSTALDAGDYMEVRGQFYQLVRDLEIGPEGTGTAYVRPSIRTSPADGEDVITDNPKIVARITSDLPRRSGADKFTPISFSWEEV